MNIEIIHELLYDYTGEVWLEPHYLYMHPKLGPYLKANSYSLDISPTPDFVSKNIDSADNIQQIAFFSKKTNHLHIKAVSQIEITEYNPYSFIYHPFESSKLPIKYAGDLHDSLQAYLGRTGVTTLVDQTARQIAASVNWDTNSFLSELNTFIHGFAYEIREEGAPYSPEITLLERRGSCRDYSVLFMAMCRSLGIAAKFVSGYYFSDPSQPQYLHAWVNVYLPGGGWRGYDPTQNCLVSGRHIPLAASALPALVSPIHGAFRGSAQSIFHAHVSLRRLDEPVNEV
jgi:transglutaminase-like putative cysteine protease